MALARWAASSLRTNHPPNLVNFFRPSALPIVRIPPRRSEKWREEDLKLYRKGGYHPVRLGDVFNDRYSVVRKLGWGSYATVWLAHDTHSKSYVALKILEACAYDGTKDLFELDILKHIKAKDPTHPGHSHILHLLDHFVHTGPHGSHVCMVFEPMGHDMFIFSARLADRKMPVFVVKEMMRNILGALDYLHHTCGVIHSDLKPRNILVSMNHHAPEIIHEFLWQTQPKAAPLEESESESESPHLDPEHVTKSCYLNPDAPDWLISLNYKLADVGVASWVDNHLTEWIQPNCFRAPEVILGAKWDTSADIWNLGCLLYELLAGKILFSGYTDKVQGYGSIVHLAQMVALLGPPPDDLLAQGKHRDKYVNEFGNLPQIPDIDQSTLQELLTASRPDITDEKVVELEEFLKAMLQFRPGDRMPAHKLLAHRWLESWN